MQTDNGFVTLKIGRKNLLSILENMVSVPFDMTLVCKAKIVIRKFSEFKNKKINIQIEMENFFMKFETYSCLSDSQSEPSAKHK
jgi:hypothetical protein